MAGGKNFPKMQCNMMSITLSTVGAKSKIALNGVRELGNPLQNDLYNTFNIILFIEMY